jgi:hypothetical protein
VEGKSISLGAKVRVGKIGSSRQLSGLPENILSGFFPEEPKNENTAFALIAVFRDFPRRLSALLSVLFPVVTPQKRWNADRMDRSRFAQS